MRHNRKIDAHYRIDPLVAVALALVACAAPPPPAPPASAVHVVRPGDTLSQIAEGYAVDVDQLAQANQLPDADRIAVGQHLQIPAPSADTALAEALVAQAADLYRNAHFEVALERTRQAEVILAARESSPAEEPNAR